MKFSLQTALVTHKFETYSDLLDTTLTLERAQKQQEEYRNRDNKKRSFQNGNGQTQNSNGQNKQFPAGNNNNNPNRNNNNNNNNRNNQNPNKRRWNPNQNGNQGNQRPRGGCPRCGNNHEERLCPMVTGACFHCGEKGHIKAHCPKMPPQQNIQRQNQGSGRGPPPRVQGRVFAMTQREAETSNEVVRGNNYT